MVHTTAQGGGRSSGELREEGDAEMRREGGMSAGRRHEVSDWTTNPAPPGYTWALPLTASVAEVFSCPHTHEYSPASSAVSSRRLMQTKVPHVNNTETVGMMESPL